LWKANLDEAFKYEFAVNRVIYSANPLFYMVNKLYRAEARGLKITFLPLIDFPDKYSLIESSQISHTPLV
jgi:hypothetical protein